MVTTRYMGVYWVKQKEESPGDGTVCVFHRKGNKEDNIRFGYYAFGGFYEKVGKNKYQRIDQRHIDYWMAIPVFPDEWSVVSGQGSGSALICGMREDSSLTVTVPDDYCGFI